MWYKFKLFNLILVLGLLLVPASILQAAQQDTVAVTVTITPSIGVCIPDAPLGLGPVAAGSITPSPSGVVVTNCGSGVNETYSLSLTDPEGWTASQTAPGSEVYVLNAAFDSDGTGIIWNEANHALSTSAAVSSATKFAGDQTGVSVPYNAERKLWFQFKAPTATSVSTEQSIVVTVTAQAS